MLEASRMWFGRIVAGALLMGSVAADARGEPHPFHHVEPGNVAYYVLVLDWSPTYCLREGEARGDMHCNSDRSDEFALHGLWPQYAQGWPEDCYEGERPWVPSAVIDSMRDVMPSKEHIIHEYKTHGTCTGLAPEPYYEAVRKAFEQVSIPAAYVDPKAQRFVSPAQVESEFIAANDWLEPDMIAVTCRRGNLFDVRICFDNDLRPQACGANINQKRLCPLKRITVTVP